MGGWVDGCMGGLTDQWITEGSIVQYLYGMKERPNWGMDNYLVQKGVGEIFSWCLALSKDAHPCALKFCSATLRPYSALPPWSYILPYTHACACDPGAAEAPTTLYSLTGLYYLYYESVLTLSQFQKSSSLIVSNCYSYSYQTCRPTAFLRSGEMCNRVHTCLNSSAMASCLFVPYLIGLHLTVSMASVMVSVAGQLVM